MAEAISPPLVLGVDGGNSRTDLVLADAGGHVLARLSGVGTRPHVDGWPVTVRRLAALVARARTAAGLPDDTEIACAVFHLANIDVPADAEESQRLLTDARVAARVEVGNDTLALLRAGAPDGWGIAVVCGAGVNAVGRAPDGRVEGFLALGAVTGDVGGGAGIGVDGLGRAVRAGDGRGPATALRELIPPAWPGGPCADVEAVAVAARTAPELLHHLAPAVLAAAAEGDAVAAAVVDRAAAEVAAMVTALLRRLGLDQEEVPVVLAGGLFAADAALLPRVLRRLAAAAPRTRPRRLDVEPVAGPVLAALDLVGAPPAAGDAVRRATTAGLPENPSRSAPHL